MDSGREGVIPLDDKELKNFAKFINIDGKYRFYNDDNDLIKIQQETIDQLTNNWNELEEWIVNEIEVSKKILDHHWFYYQIVLNKMKEIKEGNK